MIRGGEEQRPGLPTAAGGTERGCNHQITEQTERTAAQTMHHGQQFQLLQESGRGGAVSTLRVYFSIPAGRLAVHGVDRLDMSGKPNLDEPFGAPVVAGL